LVLLASCAVGPDFVHPAAPEITRYTREPIAATSAADVADGARQRFVLDRDIPQQWWALYRSPALNALIERSLANNPNLQSALATLRAAQQAVYAQEGKFFPLVQANFNPTRQQTAASLTPIPASGASIYNLYTAQLQVSYTFDVWGLNRRTVESLQALADVQNFQVEATYLALTSNVAVAAITEASLRGQIDATNQLIAINSKMVDTLRRQFDKGLVNRSDLAVQEAALAQVKATLPPLRKTLAQQRDLLAALSGAYPADGPGETFKLANLHLPVELPVSLPSQMIEQRPDVRAAEEQLHAASAQVGVATASVLPTFTINADGGYMNTVFASLISPQSLAWSLVGNATQTVFDGGALLHQLEGAKDTYQAAAWTYRGIVISAVQNVADSLRALQNDADALRAARDFERAASISLDLAQKQFNAGNTNVLLMLTAQQTDLQARIGVVQAQAARLTDTAALFQALGGGWWNRAAPPAEKILNVGTGETTPVADRHD
jgi:NodT family efflux transporter outer membrane factor (OMF) lipoprotein